MFGENVRTKRFALVWTQTELGVRSSVDQTHISQIESGWLNVTLKTMHPVAGGLGSSVTEMLTRPRLTSLCNA